MNPYETNTTPRQRCEQRVLGAIIARPWLLARAVAAGLHEERMREPGHKDVVRAMVLVGVQTGSTLASDRMVQVMERWIDSEALGGAPIADGLRALKLIAEQDLGPGRREDVRALAMLLDDIDTLKTRDTEADNLPMLAPPDAVIEDGATVDLEDLERKARAATQGDWWVRVRHENSCDVMANVDNHMPVVAEDAAREDAEHIAANGPRVTLALIARIRAFEKRAALTVAVLESTKNHDPSEWAMLQHEAICLRELLDNGTVLP